MSLIINIRPCKLLIIASFVICANFPVSQTWIRVNQLGYLPESVKVAVVISENEMRIKDFTLWEATGGKTDFRGKAVMCKANFCGMKSSERLNYFG